MWNKLLFILISFVILSGCSSNHHDHQPSTSSEAEHNHHHSGTLPEGLKEKNSPLFPIGSKVKIHHGHMDGMEGAEAKVVGAYDTIAYSIDYTSSEGEKVKDHKWIVQEEVNQFTSTPYKVGDTITTSADHMPGMKNVSAQIASVNKITVYVVDFKSTTTGKWLTNHMWVTEDELEAIK